MRRRHGYASAGAAPSLALTVSVASACFVSFARALESRTAFAAQPALSPADAPEDALPAGGVKGGAGGPLGGSTSALRGAFVSGEGPRFMGLFICELNPACRAEAIHVLLLVSILISMVAGVIITFFFFRDDKEEHITPLCPQMVTREGDLSLVIGPPREDLLGEDVLVVDDRGHCVCKLLTDHPEETSSAGVACSMRLLNKFDQVAASVVVRQVAVAGQALTLCRAGYEIFGFVEPDGDRRYYVKHRTGVILLTLLGDFDAIDVEVVNPVGVKVGEFKQIGEECHGHIVQFLDAGLALCAIMATKLHRRMTLPAIERHEALADSPASSFEQQPIADQSIEEQPAW